MKFLLLLLIPLFAQATQLEVTRVSQQTNKWCWLASSEMILKYHGACTYDQSYNMQCSMIKYLAWSQLIPAACFSDCKLCPYNAGNVGNVKLVVDHYTTDSSKNCGPKLTTKIERAPAARTKLVREIKMKRPFMIGINPSLTGQKEEAEHLAVVVGYEGKGEDLIVRVADPFDYVEGDNPYVTTGAKRVEEGVYDIPYKTLVKEFAWQVTVYVRR